MKELKKIIEERLLKKVNKAWEGVEFPFGAKSDMDISENELKKIISGELAWSGEEVVVEKYFNTKSWEQIEPYNGETRYIPLPLNYMNDASALYYSRCYLIYFIENVNEIDNCDYGFIENSFDYFREYDNYFKLSEGKFHKLKNVTNEQIEVVEEVTNYILPYVQLSPILIGSDRKVDPIKSLNTSYKKISSLQKQNVALEEDKSIESKDSQINNHKKIIDSYKRIINSYEQIFTARQKRKMFINEKIKWFKTILKK